MIRSIKNSDIIVATRPNGGFAIDAGIGRHRRHILLSDAEAASLAAEYRFNRPAYSTFRWRRGAVLKVGTLNNNITHADILFDNAGHVGLRFDNGQIFSLPAPLAAHLGRNLVECAHEVRHA